MANTDKKPNGAMIVGYILISFICVLVIVTSVRSAIKVKRIESWPTAKGTIERSDLDESWGGVETRYTANIKYRYTVDSKSYTSDRVGPWGSATYNKKNKTVAVLKRFPLGSQVPVYYNENDPGESYLEAKIDTSRYILIGCCAFGAFLFGAAAYTSIKGRR